MLPADDIDNFDFPPTPEKEEAVLPDDSQPSIY